MIIDIGLVGFLLFVLLAWGLVLVFYIGVTLFRNKVLAWDESWRKQWEEQSGRRIEQYKAELDASLGKWRLVSWLVILSILLMVAAALVIFYLGHEQGRLAKTQTLHLLWLVILFALAVPMPALVCINMGVNVLRRMILKVEDFIYVDLRREYDEKVRQLTELNEQRRVDYERWKTSKRAEIARKKAMTRDRSEGRKKHRELEVRMREEEQRKKRMAMEADLEREEILKKVEG